MVMPSKSAWSTVPNLLRHQAGPPNVKLKPIDQPHRGDYTAAAIGLPVFTGRLSLRADHQRETGRFKRVINNAAADK